MQEPITNPPIPPNEDSRLDSLKSYNLLDTFPEDQFDRLTRLAASICGVPIALVSLIDQDRQWFKSKVGLESQETSRDISFCQYAIMENKILEIEDSKLDLRFMDNPLVVNEPNIRFYAGSPLVMPDGHILGTLCVIDRIPRKLTQNQKESLILLAEEVVHNILTRKEQKELLEAKETLSQNRKQIEESKKLLEYKNKELEKTTTLFNHSQHIAKLGAWELDIITGKTFWTDEVYSIHEVEKDFDHNKLNGIEFYHPEDRSIISKAIDDTVIKQIPFDVICRFITAKGNLRWVRSSGYPVLSNGEVTRLIGMFHDITESRKSELAIIESKNNYEQLVSYIPIGIYKVTENFEFKYVSPVWCKILNLKQEEVLADSSLVLRLIHPDDLDKLLDANKIAIENKSHFDQEIRHIIKGEVRWLHLVSYPFLQNNTWQWFGTLTDVTERKLVQLELQENRSRYASIIKALPDLIFRFNSEGIFLDYNSNDISLLAMPPEAFLGKSISEVIPSDLAKLALLKIKETLRSNQLVKFEYSLEHNSSVRHWEGRMVKANEDEVLYIARDITSEALVQRELEKTKNFLAQTNQVAKVGGWEYNVITGEIIWTDTIRQIHEVDPDFIPNYEQMLSFYEPKSREKLHYTIQIALSEGKDYDLELQIITGKGKLLWVRGKGNVEMQNGACVRLYGTFQDINDQKTILDQLNRSEKMLKAISESTAELLANPNTKISLQNSLARIGKSLEADQSYYFSFDYSGKQATCSLEFECYADERPDAFNIPSLQNLPLEIFQEPLNALIKGKCYQNIVVSISEKEPIKKFLEEQNIKSLVLVPILLHNSLRGIIGFDDLYKERVWSDQEVALLHSFADSLATAIERSELEMNLKLAKEQAEEASRFKSEFLANMSHEIRTPLNSVIGFSELLMQTQISENQMQYMQAIHLSGNNLLDIVNDILDFSKIEAGKMELSLEKTNIRYLIEQVTEIFRINISQKQIELKIIISSNVPEFVYIDPIRIRQVLINLVSNSFKFTEHGQIVIELEIFEEFNDKGFQMFQFSVSDTGIGISDSKQKNIFEAFSQEDVSITRKYGGTGLGLTISNKLLALMDSHMELESKLNVGSRFFFNIFLQVEGSKQILLNDSSILEKKPVIHLKGKPKILIVDDNQMNRLLAKSMVLSILPEANILEAENGEIAIDIYKQQNPALVLMDIQMPIMSGYEATAKIKELERVTKANVPIVALTAGTVIGEKQKCLDYGMNDYLSKPIDRKSLESILYKWLVRLET